MPGKNLHIRSTFVALVFFLSFFLKQNHSLAQPPLFRNFEYVEKYSGEALQQMLQYGIPASVILAQAIIESRSGTSDMALRSNNHFGIKCHREWGGDTILKTDDTLNECFRKYENVTESYTDHSLFLLSRARYAPLFEIPLSDYQAWCYGLKNAGYATAPQYAEDLITVIENLKLYQLDGPQILQKKKTVFVDNRPLQTSTMNQTYLSLHELALTSLLFTDERDVEFHSLSLLTAK